MKKQRDLSTTGCGCPGIYTLDCYCDQKSPHHAYNEFPHQFLDEMGSKCRATARRCGWFLDFKNSKFLCPKCNPKSRKFCG